MTNLLRSASFLCVLGCGVLHQDDVIVSACLVSTDAAALPMAEVVFGSTFDPDCQWVPETSCEVSLEGDVLVVQGEASWRDRKSRFCGSNDLPLGAACEVPAGWENATTLDWGTGSTTTDTPPLVGLGQGVSADCQNGCRVGDGGTLCGM